MFSSRFYELQVAHHWHLVPDKWDAIDNEEKRAEMIAHYNVSNKMANYESYLNEKELGRKNRANRNL